jgi:hypothetical protein
MRRRVPLPQVDRFIIVFQGIAKFAQSMERVATIEMRLSMLRPERDCSLVTAHGIRITMCTLQGNAAVEKSICMPGVNIQGAVIADNCILSAA